jgi:hypothetical protein
LEEQNKENENFTEKFFDKFVEKLSKTVNVWKYSKKDCFDLEN